MINQQTLAQLLSAFGPQTNSLMSSPASAMPAATGGSPGIPGAPAGGSMAPNLGAIAAQAQARATARPGGMFAQMMQAPPMQASQQPSQSGSAGGLGGMSPYLLAALMGGNGGASGAMSPINNPGNNYYYGMAGGQGNPLQYGSSGMFGGGTSAFAGMGAPT